MSIRLILNLNRMIEGYGMICEWNSALAGGNPDSPSVSKLGELVVY